MSLRDMKESRRDALASSGASFCSQSSDRDQRRWNSSTSSDANMRRTASQSPDLASVSNGGNKIDTRTADPIAAALLAAKKGLPRRTSSDSLSNSNHSLDRNRGRVTASGAWIDPLSTSDHNRPTGDWMSSHSTSSSSTRSELDWSNHSDGAGERVLKPRYPDHGDTAAKIRFTSETQREFKPKKTTPSGRALQL